MWEAINVVTPVIVIVEYNYRFGKEKALTIPYDETFVRSSAHYSNIYYGASLKAFCLLAGKKGYAFVGCNSAGNNAFFVLKDVKPESVRELTVDEGFAVADFREARDEDGKLSFLTLEQEQEILSSLPVVEVG